jgi:Domain of unknown function (DUF1998)
VRGRDSQKTRGQIRQSQLISTFGPGSMVDLPNHAGLIGGLEFWSQPDQEIFEERLASKIARVLGLPRIRMFRPPVDPPDALTPSTGVTAWLFPQWFVVQREWGSGSLRSRRLVHYRSLEKGSFLDRDRSKQKVVPVRFVEACVNGHIGDIDWRGFAHKYMDPCQRELWIDERGTTGEIADIVIRCECGAAQPLVLATQIGANALGFCNGERPWLGPHSRERCGGEQGPAQQNRLLIRSATNAYFPQLFSAISIPDAEAELQKAVDATWADLEYVDTMADLERELRKPKIRNALERHPAAAVFAEAMRRKGGMPPPTKTVKQAEIETLLSSEDEVGDDTPHGDYFARRMPLGEPHTGVTTKIDRVVLVHRLREVRAQVGFTRFEPVVADLEGELNLDVRRAAIAREISWVPAVENRGEGIFVAIDREMLRLWRERPAVIRRGTALLSGFQAWQKRRPDHTEFPKLDYILLHSLSHLLITTVALECGYGATSIRERIYQGTSGYGILLFTGSTDAEGTLGGLVHAGRSIQRFLRDACEMGTLCSNDPVCAQHNPADPHEERFLNGAACHGCLLIAETSCERRNEFLDRALVVPTVTQAGAEFFVEADL